MLLDSIKQFLHPPKASIERDPFILPLNDASLLERISRELVH